MTTSRIVPIFVPSNSTSAPAERPWLPASGSNTRSSATGRNQSPNTWPSNTAATNNATVSRTSRPTHSSVWRSTLTFDASSQRNETVVGELKLQRGHCVSHRQRRSPTDEPHNCCPSAPRYGTCSEEHSKKITILRRSWKLQYQEARLTEKSANSCSAQQVMLRKQPCRTTWQS